MLKKGQKFDKDEPLKPMLQSAKVKNILDFDKRLTIPLISEVTGLYPTAVLSLIISGSSLQLLFGTISACFSFAFYVGVPLYICLNYPEFLP